MQPWNANKSIHHFAFKDSLNRIAIPMKIEIYTFIFIWGGGGEVVIPSTSNLELPVLNKSAVIKKYSK